MSTLGRLAEAVETLVNPRVMRRGGLPKDRIIQAILECARTLSVRRASRRLHQPNTAVVNRICMTPLDPEMASVLSDMRNPAYQNDEEFRAAIEKIVALAHIPHVGVASDCSLEFKDLEDETSLDAGDAGEATFADRRVAASPVSVEVDGLRVEICDWSTEHTTTGAPPAAAGPDRHISVTKEDADGPNTMHLPMVFPISIGRDPTNTIVVKGAHASGTGVAIVKSDANRLELYHERTRNGVFMNGVSIPIGKKVDINSQICVIELGYGLDDDEAQIHARRQSNDRKLFPKLTFEFPFIGEDTTPIPGGRASADRTPIPGAGDETTPIPPSRAVRECMLEIRDAGGVRAVPARGKTFLGKTQGLRVNATYVSARHAVLIVEGTEQDPILFKDLSTNGSFLADGRRLPKDEEVALSPGVAMGLGGKLGGDGVATLRLLGPRRSSGERT